METETLERELRRYVVENFLFAGESVELAESQQEFYFSLPYDKTDRCLWARDHVISARRIAKPLGLTEAQVERVLRDNEGKRRVAALLHAPAALVSDLADGHARGRGAMRAALTAVLLAFALGCERGEPRGELAPVAAPVAADLELVRGARVFFAHMSVGENVLAGVARIHGSGLALAERPIDSTAELPAKTFSHALFGQNGDPDAKIAAFEKVMAGLSPSPDVALMKFCYADVRASTDTHALFTHYREAFARLQAAHPNTVFVHVTAPLTVRDTGAKDLIERVTGLSDGLSQANVRRDEYNARLRAAYRGQSIFDLAEVESHWPDGRAEFFRRGGTSYPSLVPVYSDDGHHLAGAGEDRAAAALIHTLAEALRRGLAR